MYLPAAVASSSAPPTAAVITSNLSAKIYMSQTVVECLRLQQCCEIVKELQKDLQITSNGWAFSCIPAA